MHSIHWGYWLLPHHSWSFPHNSTSPLLVYYVDDELMWPWSYERSMTSGQGQDLSSGHMRPKVLPSINLWCSFCMQLWTRQESGTDKHTDRHYRQIRDSHSITHLCPCLVHLSGKIHKMWILVSKSLYSNDDDKLFFFKSNQIYNHVYL